LQEKEEKLSEERATSDRFVGKSRKAVKRRGNLRQVCREKQKSCQENEQLKTGLQVKAEKLSKAGAASKRFAMS